jgi:hypothetical protein
MAVDHRALAVELFNFVWALLERDDASAGDRDAAERELALARELGAAIADAGDREQLERELATVLG